MMVHSSQGLLFLHRATIFPTSSILFSFASEADKHSSSSKSSVNLSALNVDENENEMGPQNEHVIILTVC
jgi:hypothetical protein